MPPFTGSVRQGGPRGAWDPVCRGGRGYRRTVDQRTHEQAELADGHTECAGCGAVAEGTPPTWTLSVENGERRYYCDTCARKHLRAIEGRLDSNWW